MKTTQSLKPSQHFVFVDCWKCCETENDNFAFADDSRRTRKERIKKAELKTKNYYLNEVSWKSEKNKIEWMQRRERNEKSKQRKCSRVLWNYVVNKIMIRDEEKLEQNELKSCEQQQVWKKTVSKWIKKMSDAIPVNVTVTHTYIGIQQCQKVTSIRNPN